MQPSQGTRKWIQLALALAIAAAGIRLALIYRARHEPLPRTTRKALPLPPEAYVAPKKLYAYDLRSAQQVTKQPVWVKEGYKYVIYPWDPVRHRSDFRHEAGRLGPIERLEIKEIRLDASPGSPDQRQVMAVFEKEGKWYAFPVGAERRGEYRLYLDEILYIQDPHQLYSFWPAEVWQAIEHHEVKSGMDELQASFAVGVGLIESPVGSADRVLRYPNAGNPLLVTYHDGKAIDVRPAGPIPERQA
jgi:hypothetical protein